MADTNPDESAEDTTAEVDQAKWEEHQAVTGRPNDIPAEGPPANSTFAERAAARNKQQKAETAKTDEPPARRRGRAKATS